MSYTPINWQNGDVITAEKMNKMDNGWSVTSEWTTEYEGNVTTTGDEAYEAQIAEHAAYASASVLKVTLDNVQYTLTGFDDGGYWTWGAPYGDYSEYSFSIYIGNPDTSIFTSQVAGTYSLKIESEETAVETSDDFDTAVNSAVVPSRGNPLEFTASNISAVTLAAGGTGYVRAFNYSVPGHTSTQTSFIVAGLEWTLADAQTPALVSWEFSGNVDGLFGVLYLHNYTSSSVTIPIGAITVKLLSFAEIIPWG